MYMHMCVYIEREKTRYIDRYGSPSRGQRALPVHPSTRLERASLQPKKTGLIWLYLDAEVLVLPPPVLSLGLCFCRLPNFVDIQLLHPSASPNTIYMHMYMCVYIERERKKDT